MGSGAGRMDGVGSALIHSDALTAAARHAAALSNSIEDVLTASTARTSDRLKETWPKLSAATLNPLINIIPLVLGVLSIAAICSATSIAMLCIFVVLPVSFRLWVALIDLPPHTKSTDLPNEELPRYSVIAPLRGEARVVAQLLTAIERLDYPRGKLDVILAVEADDPATRAAITAREHRVPLMVIPVPPTNPGTKPKALNVALEFARGDFTVIYDAEDRPDPDQLRSALRAFHSGGSKLACVQARLCMDTGTSWCARYFTAEYAGHFDIFLSSATRGARPATAAGRLLQPFSHGNPAQGRRLGSL